MEASLYHDRRWKILVIVAIAQLMVVLDTTIVNIALPSAQKALGFSFANRQWIVTAYALAFGSLLLLGGRISDLFGRKWTLISGLLGFAAASAVGGAATSFAMLTAARAFQGAFGAILAPAALSILSTTFEEPSERNKAFAIYGAIAGSGASIGLILGGVLTDSLNWRFSMYVNLLFAVGSAIGAAILLANEPTANRVRIDVAGTLSVSAALFALVFGFSQAQRTSWSDPLTLSMVSIGGVLLVAFIEIERRVAHPLLPLRVVTERNRAASFISIGVVGAGMFAVLLFLTYYLQLNRGYSPLRTGFAYLPLTASVMVAAMIGNVRLRPKVGPKSLVFGGMLLAASGLLYLTQLGVTSSYLYQIVPAMVLCGVGLGFAISCAINGATAGVAPKDSGVASATVSASQQVGGAIGIAVLSTVAANATTSALSSIHHAPATLHPSLSRSAQVAHAVVHGYTTGFAWGAAIFALGALAAGLLYERDAHRLDLPANGAVAQVA